MINFESHDLYTTKDADRPLAICDSNGEVVLSLCKRCGRGEAELWDEPCPAVASVSETRTTLPNGTVLIQKTFVPPQIAAEDAPGLYLESGEFVPAAELNGLLQDEPGQGARQLSKALAEKPGARLQARKALAETLSEEIPGWEHLKAYGYAPGNYMSRCYQCDATPVMDKRARTCRPCAEKLHTAALSRMNQQDVVLSITTAYEQGIGHALRTELRNPYAEGSCEWDAWAMGREVGARKTAKTAALSVVQVWQLHEAADALESAAEMQNRGGHSSQAEDCRARACELRQIVSKIFLPAGGA